MKNKKLKKRKKKTQNTRVHVGEKKNHTHRGAELGANSATLNDNDMATGLRHRLIAGRRRGKKKRRRNERRDGVRRQEVQEMLEVGMMEVREAEAIIYASAPAVLVFCIYETLSTLKVRDQRMVSKAFSEWGAEIQGDV